MENNAIFGFNILCLSKLGRCGDVKIDKSKNFNIKPYNDTVSKVKLMRLNRSKRGR